MNLSGRRVHKFGKCFGWRWCLRRREGWHRWRHSGARLHAGPKRCVQLVPATFYDASLGAVRCLKTGVTLRYTLTQNIGTHIAYIPLSLNPLLSSSSSSSSSSSNVSLLSFGWEIFTYPGILLINRIRLGSLVCSLKVPYSWTCAKNYRFLQLSVCGGIVLEEALDLSFDRLLMMMIYVFRCKLSLIRLCDSDFGITPVDDITIGITCAAFYFHIAHISFASSWYLFFCRLLFWRDYVYLGQLCLSKRCSLSSYS